MRKSITSKNNQYQYLSAINIFWSSTSLLDDFCKKKYFSKVTKLFLQKYKESALKHLCVEIDSAIGFFQSSSPIISYKLVEESSVDPFKQTFQIKGIKISIKLQKEKQMSTEKSIHCSLGEILWMDYTWHQNKACEDT